MFTEKLPPHDIEAEEAVIGSLVIDSDAIFKIATFLKPEDFYREKNQWAYEACFFLYERNEAINQVTVAHELARRERLEAVGGAAYLSHLIANVPTSVHVEHYAQIVHRTSVLRRLISSAAQIAAIGYEAGPDIDAALGRAEDILFRLRHGESPRDFVHIRQVLDQYFEESELALRPREGEVALVRTGFPALDDILGGLQRSDMIVLAARPSLGKTSLALSIARNAAIEQKARVAIFSLEMAREQLVNRLLASESGVDARRLRLGQQTEAEERRIIEATGVLSEAQIYVDDSPILRIVEMRSKARRLHLERGIDLMIVDYMQLMRGDGREGRVQEMSEISRSLKELARELDVPLLAISQLSRAPEWRASHRPQLSDLRESGSIEQDADVVMFIYRDDMYYTKDDWLKQHPEKEPNEYPKGIADIIIGKHRNGPMGQVNLRFLERVVKFVGLEKGT
ncbi:MAG: replicative DNA helicase [Dehalococcoidia bacterium]|nr:MAG: replicative DNA helicase [Dehalococcoidia bacterium]